MTENPTLDAINSMPLAQFVAALGDIFEHAPWAAESAWQGRPYATVTELHQAMFKAVCEREPADRIAFLNGHPDLGGALARARAMTEASNSEQGGLGLDKLDNARFAQFEAMNTAYKERFGIPFILCVRRHTRASVLRQFARRLENPRAVETDAAIAEVFHITRLRVADRITGPGMPAVNGRLSTHVLDTTTGKPAANIPIALFELDDGKALTVTEAVTNADGRTDAPLLGGAPLRIGQYELRFDMRPNFAGRPGLADPPYFDTIPIRFAIAEPEGHYHVPLLATPWSYTTYRGS